MQRDIYSGSQAHSAGYRKGGESGYSLEYDEDNFLPESYVPRQGKVPPREDDVDPEDETFEERRFMEQQWAMPAAGEYRARTLLRDRRGDVINPWKELRVDNSRAGSAHLPVELGGLGLPLSPTSELKPEKSAQKAGAEKDPSDGIGSNPGSESAVNLQKEPNDNQQSLKQYRPQRTFRIKQNPRDRSVDDQRTAEESEYFPEHDFSLDDDEHRNFEPRSKNFSPGSVKPAQDRSSPPRVALNPEPVKLESRSLDRRLQKPNWYHEEAPQEEFLRRNKKNLAPAKIEHPERLPVAGKLSDLQNQRTPVHEFHPEDIRLPATNNIDNQQPRRRNVDESRDDPALIRQRLQLKYRDNVHSNLTGKHMLGVFKYLPEVLADGREHSRHNRRTERQQQQSKVSEIKRLDERVEPAGLRPLGEKLSLIHPGAAEESTPRKRPRQPEFIPKYEHIKNYRDKMHNSVIREIFKLPGSAAELSQAERSIYAKIGERVARSQEQRDTNAHVRPHQRDLSSKKPSQLQQHVGRSAHGYKSAGVGAVDPERPVVVRAALINRPQEDEKRQELGKLTDFVAGVRKQVSRDCVSDLVGSDTLKPYNSVEAVRLRSPISRKSEKVRFENEINYNSRGYSGSSMTTRVPHEQSNSRSSNQKSVSSGMRGQQAFIIDQVKLSHLVEQSTSLLAKYLHRVGGISELSTCLRREVGLLGLGKKGPHLQSAVQKVVRHEDFDVALHRVYGPSKRKVERVKKSIWRRVVVLSNVERKAKLKLLLTQTSS